MISESNNEDCLIGMKRYPDKFFDLAVVDPQTGQDEGNKHASRPYSVRQKNGATLSIKRTHVLSDWDSAPPTQEYFYELFRVSKHQIIMCENYLHFNQKFQSAGRIIWNLLRDNDFSACQIMWTSLTNKIDYFEYLWSGMMQGEAINSRKQIGDKSKNERRIHPSQKPIIVYKHLLSEYAQQEWKILDTHLGSGSSRIAAHELGFDFTGFERDTHCFEQQEKRFKNFISQTKLQFA